MGGEDHGAAIGLDQLLVGRQRVDRRLVDREADEGIARELQRDLIPRAQGDGAEPGRDYAFVDHLRREQCDVSPVRRPDRPPVDDRSRAATVAERVATGEEIGIREAERRGHDPAHVDLGALTEEHAVRVQHEHLAVGGQPAQDDRGVLPEDPVQRDGARVGLTKNDRFGGADAEALPVDGKARARLLDRERVAGLADDAAAGADLRAGRQGVPRKR